MRVGIASATVIAAVPVAAAADTWAFLSRFRRDLTTVKLAIVAVRRGVVWER